METLGFNEQEENYKKQIFDLKTLLEIGKTLNASLSLNDVLNIVVLTCNGHFHASDAIILLASKKNDKEMFISKTEGEYIELDITAPFIKFLKESQKAIDINELKNIKDLELIYKSLKSKEINLIVPMKFKGNINGLLLLKEKEKEFGETYTENEKQYLDIIAGFASVAIENAKLYEMATLDRKTKLYNHGYFQNRLIEEIERAEKYKTDLTLMIMDLDHFKKINDTYGHMKGDEVLIKVAETIKKQVREFDIPARFGGEEFTVILPETTPENGVNVAERLRLAIKNLNFESDKGDFKVTVSIGLSNYIHSSNMTEDMLIEQADKALYYAKEHGRNQVILYGQISNKKD